jgi:hypothetical protein
MLECRPFVLAIVGRFSVREWEIERGGSPLVTRAVLRYYLRMPAGDTSSALEEVFLSVWRQSLIDRAKQVAIAAQIYPVRRTAKRRLAQVDFEFEGVSYRGLEQNPETASRWAQLARQGAKVMQFLSNGRYLAAIADGKITHYTAKKS